jgi:tetratricopeptide (TPR) repeat protein
LIRALALVAIAAQLVHADPGKINEAKAHFKQAKAYQEAGAFARAVDEYKAAYELDPRPELLFNIAQAYRLAGDKKQALANYKRYLLEQPDGKGADEARVLVAELERQIDEDSTRLQPIPVPPVPVPPVPVPTHVDPPQPAPDSGSTLKIAGIASAGVGLVAVGVGVKFGLDARAASNAITTHTGPWTMAEMTRFEDGQRASRNMVISYVAGGVLVAAGGVMYWLGTRSQAVPVVTAQSAGVAVTGRF